MGPLSPNKRGIAYLRVSTGKQVDSGASLDDQRGVILKAAEDKDIEVVAVIEDAGISAKTMEREGVQEALRLLRAGEADVLIAAKLDRLSRSTLDFYTLVEESRRGGWSIMLLDPQVDMNDPMGEVIVGVLAVFAQFERRMISERTKRALAVKRAQGVRIGVRRDCVPDEVRVRILRERKNGRKLRAIAEDLERDGIPAPRGKHWALSTISDLVRANTT